jgi:type I restriction-modification system DNA methylase subunit
MSKDQRNDVQLNLIYSDETQFKYWNSRLFNEVYVRRDLPIINEEDWEEDDTVEFQGLLNTLRNLAKEYGHRKNQLNKWSETETINNWIKHILNALGWSNNCSGVQNPFLEETSFNFKGRTLRTDLLIVDLPKEKQYINNAASKDKIAEARDSVLIPVEAKYWGRLEQVRKDHKEEKNRTDIKSDDLSKSVTPNEQIVRYMEALQKDWGVLTDGATWRLFYKGISNDDPERYFEFNLSALIDSMLTEETEHDRKEVIESAKYFYFFFGKKFLVSLDGEESKVDEVLRYSKRYINRIEDNLTDRFVKAMNLTCNGLYNSSKHLMENQDLGPVRNVAESSLFNILFIKSLESRNILPMNAVDYKKISLSSILDKLEKFDPDKDDEINVRNLNRSFSKGNGNSFQFSPEGFEIHDRLVRLTRIIHDGKSPKDDFGFEIAGFRESVFSDYEWKIFRECKLSNLDWVKALFELGYAESDIKNRKYQQIPYSYFTPRQLGSIYESFLEFQIDLADCDMVFDKKQWIPANLNSKKYRETPLPVSKKGELFFTPDNAERKATGSYYTPDYIVSYIVETALTDVLPANSSEILNFKFCDPAMGSGHFLVGALRFATEKYLDVLAKESSGDVKMSPAEAKRKILDSCVFGVDINSRAVKLAKMSLWLDSAHINHKLERLDDQLVCADSLISERIWREYPALNSGGFDAVLGNPPYIARKNISDKSDEIKMEKQGDYYLEFMNLCVDRLIKENGVFSMIVPDPLLVRKNGIEFRKKVALSRDLHLIECLHVGDVFKDAKVSNVVPFIRKIGKKGKTKNITKFFKVSDRKTKELLIEKKGVTEEMLIAEVDIRADLPQAPLFPWAYLLSDSALFNAAPYLESTLQSYCVDSRGEEISKKNILNKGKIQVLTGGESIKPYQVSYENSGYVDSIKKDSALYKGLKIILQKSAPRFVAAVDKKSVVVPQSIYMVRMREDSPVDEWLICALLNSEIYNDYLYRKTTGYKILMPHYEQGDLKSLPMPKFDFTKDDFIDARDGLRGVSQKELKKTSSEFLTQCAVLSELCEQQHNGVDLIDVINDRVLGLIESVISRAKKAA